MSCCTVTSHNGLFRKTGWSSKPFTKELLTEKFLGEIDSNFGNMDFQHCIPLGLPSRLDFPFPNGLQPGGVDHGGIDAITRGQEIGAFFAPCGVLAWSIWQNRKTVSFGRAEKAGFFAFVFGLVGLAVFWTFMGADWWASLAYFVTFFVVTLVLARISCQGGYMFVAMNFHPHDISGYLFGQMSVGLKNLVVLISPIWLT